MGGERRSRAGGTCWCGVAGNEKEGGHRLKSVGAEAAREGGVGGAGPVQRLTWPGVGPFPRPAEVSTLHTHARSPSLLDLDRFPVSSSLHPGCVQKKATDEQNVLAQSTLQEKHTTDAVIVISTLRTVVFR